MGIFVFDSNVVLCTGTFFVLLTIASTGVGGAVRWMKPRRFNLREKAQRRQL